MPTTTTSCFRDEVRDNEVTRGILGCELTLTRSRHGHGLARFPGYYYLVGVGPCDHAGDVSKLLPRSPAATFGTTKRTLVVAADETPGISYYVRPSLPRTCCSLRRSVSESRTPCRTLIPFQVKHAFRLMLAPLPLRARSCMQWQLPPSTLRSNRVALFGSSDRVDVSSTRAYAAPGPGAYSVEEAVEKTRLQRAPVVSFAR